MDLPDVQSRTIQGQFMLTRVGVKGVKKPIQVVRPGRSVPLVLTIDAFVDLPSNLRGVHMSRNIESINEVLDIAVRDEIHSIEDLGAHMAEDLLGRHEYATRAEVFFEGDYFRERESPSGTPTLENYRLLASAFAQRGGGTSRMIGAEVIGMNACPCGMETTRKLTEERLGFTPPDLWLTHNQRNIARLYVEVPQRVVVEADDLIDILEGAESSPTRQILKRKDEAEVILNAHLNPKFVEDIVRDILGTFMQRFPDMPDSVYVIAQSESEESIHKHNAFAERRTTLGELRSGRSATNACPCELI
ncbi:MAG: GTP cyclohydrolase MptA [Thermoplasmata archaeon]|nr:GTP cyclohydrolase MptA [Thermoplasmata archaeon]